jgi:hypothetical protein
MSENERPGGTIDRETDRPGSEPKNRPSIPRPSAPTTAEQDL